MEAATRTTRLLIATTLGIACIGLAFFSARVRAQPAPETQPSRPAIDPDADQILKATSASLAQTKQFSFNAEIWEDVVFGNGHKLSVTGTMEVQVRRPNGLHVEIRTPKRSRGIWYDGKTATLLDRATNLYSTVNAPDSIDKAFEALSDKYGITVPLDDLLLSDPYTSASKGIRSGAAFGKTTILGVPCQQVAFGTDVVDWQLWVEDGGKAMPRKVVITYRLEDAAPQYTAIFSEWNLNAQLSDSDFTFVPPQGAAKIDMLPAKPSDE